MVWGLSNEACIGVRENQIENSMDMQFVKTGMILWFIARVLTDFITYGDWSLGFLV